MQSSTVAIRVASTILLIQFALDLVVCPHSKVEESFQLQATHDLIYHGMDPILRHSLLGQNVTLPYDHLYFPGGMWLKFAPEKFHQLDLTLFLAAVLNVETVVPRTFAGPVILATLCHALRFLLLPLTDILARPMLMQSLARGFLLLINAHGWIDLAYALEKQSKLDFCGSWFLLITASQFHMPFYASRMLPNVFALAFVLRCYSFWIKGKVRYAAAILVFATAVFRCDLLLLLATFGLSWILSRKLPIVTAIKIGIVTGILSLFVTVPLDSLLWQRLLWPEGEVLYFNTILGKSKEWGTSAWHWYFSSALPKSMLATTFLVPLSFIRVAEKLAAWERKRQHQASAPGTPLFNFQWVEYFAPILAFLILYSFLGHKEMRFIFPAIPGLNLLAAVGMTRLTTSAFPGKEKHPTIIGRTAFGCGVLCIILTWAGNLAFLAVSHKNYPGGDALRELSLYVRKRSEYQPTSDVHVFVDVASAMSGVSLFGQRSAQARNPGITWSFTKGGYEEAHAVGEDDYQQFTHILSEKRGAPPGFRTLQAIQGNPSLDIRNRKVATEDSIFIFQKTSWGATIATN